MVCCFTILMGCDFGMVMGKVGLEVDFRGCLMMELGFFWWGLDLAPSNERVVQMSSLFGDDGGAF